MSLNAVHVVEVDPFIPDTPAATSTPYLVAGPRLFAGDIEAGEKVRLPFVRTGEWDFKDYGPVQVTSSDLDKIVDNFRKDARRQDLAVTGGTLPLNEEHAEMPGKVDPASYIGPGAIGWITSMQRDGDTVFADVDLNQLGEKLLREDRYRAVSPELLLNWTDPETGDNWGKTAVGLALTTVPRMKSLAVRGKALAGDLIAASENALVLAFAEGPRLPVAHDQEMLEVPKGYALSFNELDLLLGADLDAKSRNALDDSDFALVYTDSNGDKQRKLPIHDKGHVTAAMKRFGQTDFEGQSKVAAAKKIVAKARKLGIDVSPDSSVAQAASVKSAEGVEPGSSSPLPAAHPAKAAESQGDDDEGSDNDKEQGDDKEPAANSGPKSKAKNSTDEDASDMAELADVHVDKPLPNMSVAYAYPKQERLPLDSEAQVKGSIGRFMTVDAAEGERDEAWGRIREAAGKHGVDTPETWRKLTAGEAANFLMQAAEGSEKESQHLPYYKQAAAALQMLIKQETDEGEPGDAGALIDIWQDLERWWKGETTEYGGSTVSAYRPADLSMNETRASSVATQSARINTNAEGGTPSMDPNETTAPVTEGEAPAVAAAEGTAAPEASAVEAPAAVAPSPADMAERENELKAAETRAHAAEARIKAAENEIAALKEKDRVREAAIRMGSIHDRLDVAVKTGKITPAARDKFSQSAAHFAEDKQFDNLLEAIELLPDNGAVDMREVGRDPQEAHAAGGLNTHEVLDAKAKALAVNHFKETGEKLSPKEALLRVSAAELGYRG